MLDDTNCMEALMLLAEKNSTLKILDLSFSGYGKGTDFNLGSFIDKICNNHQSQLCVLQMGEAHEKHKVEANLSLSTFLKLFSGSNGGFAFLRFWNATDFVDELSGTEVVNSFPPYEKLDEVCENTGINPKTQLNEFGGVNVLTIRNTFTTNYY